MTYIDKDVIISTVKKAYPVRLSYDIKGLIIILDFIENILSKLTAVKKSDPALERKKQIRSRNIQISSRTIVFSFAVIIVLLVVVSSIVVASEKKESETTSSTDEYLQQESLSITSAQTETQEISGNFLFALTKDDNSDLQLLAVVNVDSETSQIKVTAIPVTATCDVNNIDTTMQEHLLTGGITQLLWAVGEYSKISIERYMYCDEKDFVEIMKCFGNTEITIDETVSDEFNGINFIIESGTQSMTPDTMLKYLIYVSSYVFDYPEKLASLFSVIAQKVLNCQEAQDIQKNYEKIINYINTDISAMDIATYSPQLLDLAKQDKLENIEFTQDINTFRDVVL